MLYAVLLTDTQNKLKYHFVTVKPPFAVKMIDCLHQTGPMERKIESLGVSLTCFTIIMSIVVSELLCQNGSYSSPNVEWKLIDSFDEIFYYLNKY